MLCVTSRTTGERHDVVEVAPAIREALRDARVQVQLEKPDHRYRVEALLHQVEPEDAVDQHRCVLRNVHHDPGLRLVVRRGLVGGQQRRVPLGPSRTHNGDGSDHDKHQDKRRCGDGEPPRKTRNEPYPGHERRWHRPAEDHSRRRRSIRLLPGVGLAIVVPRWIPDRAGRVRPRQVRSERLGTDLRHERRRHRRDPAHAVRLEIRGSTSTQCGPRTDQRSRSCGRSGSAETPTWVST